MFSILHIGYFEDEADVLTNAIIPLFGKRPKPDEEKKICMKAVVGFWQRYRKVTKQGFKDGDNAKVTAAIQGAQAVIIGKYDPKYTEYVAQLYAYSLTVSEDVIARRKKKIAEICDQYFLTKEFAAAVQDYVTKYSFTIPDEHLGNYSHFACQLFLWVEHEDNQNELGSAIVEFYRTGNTAELSKKEYAARRNSVNEYLDTLKQSSNLFQNWDQTAFQDLQTRSLSWTIIFPMEEARTYIRKYASNNKVFGKMDSYLKQHVLRLGGGLRIDYKMYVELFEQLCSPKTKPTIPDAIYAIAEEIKFGERSKTNSENLPSVFRAIKSGFFEGPTIEESKTSLAFLLTDQHALALKHYNNTTKQLAKGKYTAEMLYSTLNREQEEKQDRLEEVNPSNNNNTEKKKEDTPKQNLIIQAGGESDAVLEEILEEHANSQSAITAAQPDKKDESADNEAEEKKAEVQLSPPKPQPKKRKYNPDKIYQSPKRKQEKSKAPEKPGQPVSKATGKPDQRPSPSPQTGSGDILVSVGVLRGIEYRLAELNGAITRLKNAKVTGFSKANKLEELRQEANTQLDILTRETEAGEWKLADINATLLICDNFLSDAGTFLKSQSKETSALKNFDAALWKLIREEGLISGKSWGGTINKKLGGKFEQIEARYHGRCFNPQKKVTIDGETRPLKLNETLVFYVTENSTTMGVRYCMSIKLWNLRNPDTPAPRLNARTYQVGDQVKQDDRIDPVNWRCTGMNMAVLHVQ